MSKQIGRTILSLQRLTSKVPISTSWYNNLDTFKRITNLQPSTQKLEVTGQRESEHDHEVGHMINEGYDNTSAEKEIQDLSDCEMKQTDQEVFLSTDGKQQLEVDTVNKEQQSNMQEQNKEQQHNASEEMIQTDLVYTNKNKEAAMYEEGNKLEDYIPTDQKEDKDERILCVNTETQERKSLSKMDSSIGCTKTRIRSIEHHQKNAKTNLSKRNKPKLRNGDFLWAKP
jgi:hypothetical protein